MEVIEHHQRTIAVHQADEDPETANVLSARFIPTYRGEYRCPECGTYNEVWKKRENTVSCELVYCWHCGCRVRLN